MSLRSKSVTLLLLISLQVRPARGAARVLAVAGVLCRSRVSMSAAGIKYKCKLIARIRQRLTSRASHALACAG